MRKNIFLILAVLFIVGIVYFRPMEKTASMPNGLYCYHRLQEATEAAPYRVEENIELYINDADVAGKKEGTQAGPDMTNGYFGILSGAKNENNIEVLYSFTIEGSQNAEREVYKIDENSLIKLRWPLKEEGGFLVPDKVGEPDLIVYAQTACL